MAYTYESLYGQDDSGDLGFSASPRNDAAIDKANDKRKPKPYSGKIKKGGSKPAKQLPPSASRTVDGGDRFVPPEG